MTKQKEKKLGSFKPKKEEKKSIWEYKEYILIGVVVILAAIIFILTLKNLSKNPANTQGSPTPTVTEVEADKDSGILEVETDPPGAVAQVLDKSLRTPATFKGMKEGKYFVVVRYPGYKIHNEQVEIIKNETTKVTIKMEK